MTTAFKELTDSKPLIEMMSYILAIGNYMNGGTPKGGALGFKLECLKKIGDIKSNDKKQTLLHYLVEFTKKKAPNASNFVSTLPHLEAGSKLSDTELITELEKLKKGIEENELEIKVVAAKNDEEKKRFQEEKIKYAQAVADGQKANVKAPREPVIDTYPDMMGKFTAEASRRIMSVDTKVYTMTESFRKAVMMFGEDVNTCKVNDLLTTIQMFCLNYDKAMKEVEREKALADKKEKQKLLAPPESSSSALSPDDKRGNRASAMPKKDKKGVLDNIFGSLKKGQAFQARKKDTMTRSRELHGKSIRALATAVKKP